MIKKSYLLYITLLLLVMVNLNGEITLPGPGTANVPGFRVFQRNTNITRDMSYKDITVAEYLTDPLIMYTSLWGCIGLSYAAWEKEGMWEDFPAYPISSGVEFKDRISLPPFTADRYDQVTRPFSGYDEATFHRNSYGDVVNVLKGTVIAKNVIEPFYFTGLVLYMSSKNYHPVAIVTQIVVLSLLYEFTIRPFFMYTSFEQLIKNPAVAIVLGFFLDELATFLLTTPYRGLHVLAYILNPFKLLPTARVRPLLIFKPYRQAVSLEAVVRL